MLAEIEVDIEGLQAAVDNADSLIGSLDKDAYTAESWDALTAVIAEAEELLGQAEPDANEVANMIYAIQKAVTELRLTEAADEPDEPEEPEQVSKKTLEYFLNKAKECVEDEAFDGLVESVQKLFKDAIAKGEAVMADENATREEVVDAAADLMFAIHAMEMKAADKTDLEMALEIAGMIDLDKYVEAGQKEFLEAKDAAEEVMADGDAMDEETKQAWNALVEAMEALRLKADKSVLEDLINQTAELDLSVYTEESAAAFRTALAAAKAVLTDEALSEDEQDQVDEAVNTLQAAYDALEKAQGPDTEDPDKPGTEDPDKPGTEDPDSGNQDGDQNAGQNADKNDNQNGSQTGSSDKAAKTGDSAPIAAVSVILLISAAAAVVLKRKAVK